ncbi:hypothetical protein M501DRAFT_996865 [Patellaria atrata CBS 101060]|uniref:Helicase C-terminal domain-containing protein n=1 Tax=Patellaria atrata CBS 101060 TaxID=1346257 RepID=A0A9P4S5P6_9PEZI|nr:hypothetical protein M501DRAFT_996865 [Patellaria atrata CBS 101060]
MFTGSGLGLHVGAKEGRAKVVKEIIVYCDTVARTTMLAAGNRKEKEEMLLQLTGRHRQVFVATNALGLGIDTPTIRVVIHVGESGRAGRDGYSAFRKGVEEEIKEFITSMDGREDRTGCEEGEEKCDGCFSPGQILREEREQQEEEGLGEEELEEEELEEEDLEEEDLEEEDLEEEELLEFQRETERRRARARVEMATQSRELSEVEQLERLLEEWKEGYYLWSCSKEGAKDVKWENYSCCFYCGVPQAICNRYEQQSNGGFRVKRGGICQFKDVLIESTVSIWVGNKDKFGDLLKSQIEGDGMASKGEFTYKEMVNWFTGKKRWGGIEGTKLCYFFISIISIV